MYSTTVTRYWNPDKVKVYSSQITSYTCYSSWHSRSDIANIANITGTVELRAPYKLEHINDGFFCIKEDYLSYINKNGEEGWIQADLIKHYKLKCVRFAFFRHFGEIEIRFGNFSRDQGLNLNGVIAYQKDFLERSTAEYCVDRPIVGQYVIVESYKYIGYDFLNIGSMQIIVE